MARASTRPIVLRCGLVADAEAWLGAADILVQDCDRALLTVDLPRLSARAVEHQAELDERSVSAGDLFDAVAPAVADFSPPLAARLPPLHGYCGCPPERPGFAAEAVKETTP